MFNRNQLLRFVPAIIFAACICNVQAQTPRSPEKNAAVQELVTLLGATQFAHATFVALIDQYSQALASDSIRSFEKKNWSPRTRAKMETLTQGFYDRLSKRLREELPRRIGYEEKLNRLYLEIYDEQFSEPEIRELIAFYKTPIGQKFLGFAPKVAISLQQKATAEVEVPMTTITREILNEELQLLEKLAGRELKPTGTTKKN